MKTNKDADDVGVETVQTYTDRKIPADNTADTESPAAPGTERIVERKVSTGRAGAGNMGMTLPYTPYQILFLSVWDVGMLMHGLGQRHAQQTQDLRDCRG